MDLETWIKSSLQSAAEGGAVAVAIASEIADVAMRYIEALDAGDAEVSRAELGMLRELCEERATALRTLPKRREPRRG